MSSPAKIAANRQNAKHSTGPRTTEGKNASSRNALKHGLTAKSVIIFDESEAEYEAFRADLVQWLDPVGALEAQIAQRLIEAYWSARRSPRAEAALFNDAGSHSCGVFTSMTQSVAAFTRYDVATMRKIQMLSNQLERLQARRRSEAVAAPIADTISGSVQAVAPSTTPPPEPSNDARAPSKNTQMSIQFVPPAPETKAQEPTPAASEDVPAAGPPPSRQRDPIG
jgi:hypothetical protein